MSETSARTPSDDADVFEHSTQKHIEAAIKRADLGKVSRGGVRRTRSILNSKLAASTHFDSSFAMGGLQGQQGMVEPLIGRSGAKDGSRAESRSIEAKSRRGHATAGRTG